MLAEQLFDTGELKLNYIRGSEGSQPMLLLHGITARWQDFLPIIPPLVLRHTVFALDFRGHGKSDRATDGYNLTKYAKDIVAFSQNQLQQPAVYFGHSIGAAVAIWIAARHPELTEAIIICEPAVSPELFSIPAWSEALSKWRKIAGKPFEDIWKLENLRDAFTRRRARDLSKLDPLVLEDIPAYWEGYHVDNLLGQIECPILMIYGNRENGGILTVEQAELITSKTADCVSHRAVDAGHAPHRVNPDLVFKLTSDFLESS